MTDLEKLDQVKAAEFTVHSGSLHLYLRFEPDAFATLGREIGAGYVAVPEHPAEVGGLLTGEIVQNNSDWTVTIRDVTPVAIQYHYGPSYRPTAADREVFRRHLTGKVFRHLAPDQKAVGYPIGWYRSNTRPLREPEEDDREMSRTLFECDKKIFLLCDLSPGGRRVHASCIIMQPNGAEMAFPFDLGRFTNLEDLGKSRYEEVARAGIKDTRSLDAPLASPPRAPKVEPVPLPQKMVYPV